MTYPQFDGTEPCREVDPELFFPPVGANKKQMEVAKSICATCAFQPDCLEYAISNRLPGVWGGKTELERKRIIRNHRIQRREITEAPSEQLSA